MNSFTVIRIILLFFGTLFFLYISKKSLLNFKVHGFYRFFVFEGTLILIILNIPYWFDSPFSILQIISWIFLITSVYLVIASVYYLKSNGNHTERNLESANFKFENTANLVKEGIYKYIRHPMYSSLLFLSIATMLKGINFFTIIIAVLVIIFLISTAIIEEKENKDFFGIEYDEYMKRTKMFIPFIF
ncbi:MAG TPA: protein-S-isoprenylcysteine methyltransferase [Ignavibacteriales bacterium]|nr:protein-S-isoprenylcysteine methyltransferase [Ignavibacteriales bacterium]